jgi:plasmid stabilization system protein ParE
MVALKRKIIWDSRAIDSIKSIFIFLKYKASLKVANQVRDKILREVRALTLIPEKNPKEPYLADLSGDFRFKLVWNYKIIFEVLPDRILILDIFHTSRNPIKISAEDSNPN